MIKIENIHKYYKTNHVLKGVSLICKQGKIQALLGANGTGKSTLVHIISSIMEQDNGTYFIDNEEINIDSYKYRHKVGYVFESPMYIEKFTAKEYLEFVAKMYKLPKEEIKNRINELIDFFELPTEKKKYIESYSKGMKSKVSLASALIHKPTYLILDEPFDGIDFLSVQKIGKLFKSMAENGATILLTSHQYDVISEMCDNFSLLKNGTIKFNVAFDKLKIMSKDFISEKNPVKSYIESLMKIENSKENLDFIQTKTKPITTHRGPRYRRR